MTGEPDRSSLSAHLLVRGNTTVVCNLYPDHGPILSLSSYPTHLMISLAGDVSADGLAFAHALVGAANLFLTECERLANESASDGGPAA